MRFSTTALILISLLITIVSCGGGSEAESPEPSEDPVDEVTTDTLQAAAADSIGEVEQLPEIEETVPAEDGSSGSWDTTMGELELIADDEGNVTGQYPLGTIEGIMSGNVLEFTYSEGSLEGEGTFTFTDDFSSFSGIQDIAGTELVWDGNRM